MEIEFVGAAQTVTGSKHLVHTPHATVLLDCGIVQGRRHESIEKNKSLGVDPASIDAVVLSHAHIDHSGALPLLVKSGYRGPIFTTPATRDLCAAMLADAAMIQDSDARYINKLIVRGHSDMTPVEPLYTERDVVRVLEQIVSIPYRRSHLIAPGVRLTLHDAGHVLGSASVALDVEEGKASKRLLFTGDLGRKSMPILRDPEVPTGACALITESTYGDRLHDPIGAMDEALAQVIRRTHGRGGKIVIPSFALERAQEIILALKRLRADKRIPPLPVYVDSPLATRITDVFRLHPECFDDETRALLRAKDSPFDFENLHYVGDKEESKAVDAASEPSVIIAASGMCEGGRILHHLKATIEDDRNTVVIVGFQAQHTLGRRLVEGRQRVRIFGVERERRAEVVVLNGFSAHADQRELVEFAEAVRREGHLGPVALVHGEPKAQRALMALLAAKRFGDVRMPLPGDRMEV